MEWIAAAKTNKQSAELGDDLNKTSGGTGFEWYPQRKIRFARFKLEGHNPAKILVRQSKEKQIYLTLT